MDVCLWTVECRHILLILRKMLALLIERLCDKNQEQNEKLPVGKSAVLTIMIPNSCPYILKGELKSHTLLLLRN